MGWEGDDSTSESLTVTINLDKTIQALFKLIPPVQYTLTVTAGEGGSVTDGGTYDEGTEVNITAIPNEGYSFVRWDGIEDTSNEITVFLFFSSLIVVM